MNNSQSQESPATAGTAESVPASNLAQGTDRSRTENALTRRNSLTVTELASFGASNNSAPVFQQNTDRMLRTELVANAVLIINSEI